MQLVELRMHRFKSFREPTNFTFPREPGLYFMTGRNEVQPRLGANAAGKSTVWDALTWVAFDKTPRGLRAGDVRSWGAKGQTTVELAYEDDHGTGWLVKRTSGPNSWTLQSEDDAEPHDLTKEDNPFLTALRLSFQTWVASVVMAQSEPMFLDLKPEAKTTMFGQLLDLDKWLERSKEAGKRADDVDTVCRRLERELAEASGRMASSSVGDLKQREVEWQERRAHKLAELETLYKSRLAPRNSLVEALRKAENDEREARAEFKRLGLAEKLEELEAAHEKAKARVMRSLGPLGSHDEMVKELKRQVEFVSHMNSCPTCKQSVSRQQREALLLDVEGRLSKLNRGQEAAKVEHNEAFECAFEAEEAVQRHEVVVVRHNKAIDSAVERVRQARRELELCDRELDRIEDDAADLEASVSPFADMLARADQGQAALELVVEDLTTRLRAEEEKRNHLQYWVKGFKEVRLTQMADALASLEIEVNSSLVELGLLGWELRFAVDKVNKRGTVTKGFSVEVVSPESPEAVPWEAWSGGEAQRLRLATQMGLADLIRQRTGTSLAVEVWDEPTQGINPQGLTDLLDALGDRARRERRQVWVVDHHSLGYGAFDGLATIVRTGAGSSVLFAR